MSFRTSLIVINASAFAVILGIIVWRVFSLKRNPERTPANLTPFLEDDALEGRRLERVLGWSLLFTLVIAIALPVYFLYEPTREADASAGFDERSIERGAILFANAQSPAYDATKSLLCANCHGNDGGGGAAPFVLQPEADLCLEKQNQGTEDVPECLPKQVSWSAPDLTLAPLRFDRGQLKQIITYGRPGTPMPAWGVASGKGVLNEQGINDLVNYLESIQTTPAKARAAAEKEIGKYQKDSAQLVKDKRKALTAAQAALAKTQADPTSTAAQVAADQATVDVAQVELDKAIAYDAEVQSLSDGAILFRLNCARCHTKGWSYHVTEPARADLPPLPRQGSGAYGPSLTGASVQLQFPGEAGKQQQFDWVALGVPANNLYGTRGISSGRMPHFGKVLTEDQIKAIVDYERNL